VVSGWADAVFASLRLRVRASLAGESTWGASGSAAHRLQLDGGRHRPRNRYDDRAGRLSVMDLESKWWHAVPEQQHSWIFHPRQRANLDFRLARWTLFDNARISARIGDGNSRR
jgi:hypothetical protein